LEERRKYFVLENITASPLSLIVGITAIPEFLLFWARFSSGMPQKVSKR
jgi:hypothetical protein